jgi:hypothetical protein
VVRTDVFAITDCDSDLVFLEVVDELVGLAVVRVRVRVEEDTTNLVAELDRMRDEADCPGLYSGVYVVVCWDAWEALPIEDVLGAIAERRRVGVEVTVTSVSEGRLDLAFEIDREADLPEPADLDDGCI